ncbi:MAG: hypothetical protein WCS17_04525 [Prevotella sp.]
MKVVLPSECSQSEYKKIVTNTINNNENTATTHVILLFSSGLKHINTLLKIQSKMTTYIYNYG